MLALSVQASSRWQTLATHCADSYCSQSLYLEALGIRENLFIKLIYMKPKQSCNASFLFHATRADCSCLFLTQNLLRVMFVSIYSKSLCFSFVASIKAVFETRKLNLATPSNLQNKRWLNEKKFNYWSKRLPLEFSILVKIHVVAKTFHTSFQKEHGVRVQRCHP